MTYACGVAAYRFMIAREGRHPLARSGTPRDSRQTKAPIARRGQDPAPRLAADVAAGLCGIVQASRAGADNADGSASFQRRGPFRNVAFYRMDGLHRN